MWHVTLCVGGANPGGALRRRLPEARWKPCRPNWHAFTKGFSIGRTRPGPDRAGAGHGRSERAGHRRGPHMMMYGPHAPWRPWRRWTFVHVVTKSAIVDSGAPLICRTKATHWKCVKLRQVYADRWRERRRDREGPSQSSLKSWVLHFVCSTQVRIFHYFSRMNEIDQRTFLTLYSPNYLEWNLA